MKVCFKQVISIRHANNMDCSRSLGSQNTHLSITYEIHIMNTNTIIIICAFLAEVDLGIITLREILLFEVVLALHMRT
jgi:hypothetical protein